MIRGDFHLFFVFLLFNIVERQYKRNGKDMDENNVPDMRPTNHAVDMFKVGNGAFRKVEAFHLSRMACMIISENADSRKLLVKQARAYFSQSVSTTELMQNSLESNILLYKTAQGETRIEVIFNNETFWMSQKKWLLCLVLT